jgi:hypothetical protein
MLKTIPVPICNGWQCLCRKFLQFWVKLGSSSVKNFFMREFVEKLH